MRLVVINLLLLLIYLFNVSLVGATSDKFITVVNPIRGADFFQLPNQKPVDNVKKEWQGIQEKKLVATWLIRPDALNDPQITQLLKSSSGQEVGLFMEITPSWTKKAGVDYHQNQSWHFAGSALLTGYEVIARHKLIDNAFTEFKDIFGYYPKSVGAWWIDAGSLVYMKEKYGILANLDVADQYTTDNYQVWGQYFSTPFYPAKRNALVPASGEEQKIGVVTVQWATRDPFNSYGNGVLDSTYSVQANDYANKKYHNLTTNYFQKLLSIYLDNPNSSFGQVTVGMENDFSWQEYGREYLNQLDEVSKRSNLGTQVVTMSSFSNWYREAFPRVSPPQLIFSPDPLGSKGAVVWYQSPKYRVGWFFNQQGSAIRDLRLFNESRDEACLEKPCASLNLAMMETKNLDEVTYGDKWVIDEGNISQIKVTELADGARISYVNQTGTSRTIDFLPNDIKIDSFSQPLSVAIAKAVNGHESSTRIVNNFNYQPYGGMWATLINQAKGLAIFSLFVVLVFYLPGLAFLKKSTLGNNHKFVLSWVVGISFFTLLAFALAYLKLWWVLWTVPFFAIFHVRNNLVWPEFKWTKRGLILGLVILAGSTSWLLVSVKNGLIYDYGMGFWGPNGHDAIWHLSLIEGLKRGLPLDSPVFAGVNLQNYHYFYDLLLSATSALTGLSSADLLFRFFPLLITLAIGGLTYLVAKEWFQSEDAGILATFFIYFGGSFGWILSWIKDRSFGGETAFWAQQGISTLINPPFTASVLVFLAGLYLFYKVCQQKEHIFKLLIPLVILWGSLIEFKAYAGLLMLGGLSVAAFAQILKKDLTFLKIFVPVLLLSLLVFLPNNFAGAGLLVFSPFWLVHSMVDFPDRLNWLRLSFARTAGFETGNWLKFLAAEALSLGIFLAGNLGTRVFGATSLKSLLTFKPFNLFIAAFLLGSISIPLIFIQKGANFNIVQFVYYFLLIFNFMAAASLSLIIKKFKKFGVIFVVLLAILTLPTTWGTLQQYLPARPPARISRAELEALSFLKGQPMGVVLSYYFDKNSFYRMTEPRPLFAYESTSYVSAIAAKPDYIADTVSLEILGTDYKGRLQVQKDILAAREPKVVEKLLADNNISYIYVPKLANFDPSNLNLKRIFINEEVEIFSVNR